ncbi:electron transfer flavoprotein beta subunit lysine methyltransferase-like [Musca vetustissima]|uniref:electron transfer flavoprotein beta subunit lysine methyltransferase-like n=1 Tax=Musca vetustissima TaxID=27455 RepID=UPI002AB6725E|nr:electron transfer flavoprotein beta subunit lysine methyltransferase-like [Musca vetustissima]
MATPHHDEPSKVPLRTLLPQRRDIEQTILRETKISRQHLTPDIALHLITQECRLFYEPQLDEENKVFKNDPFWAFYWPGGQALSKYVLESPELVNGKSVLDVGSGCGATSIAAILKSAKYAIANDIDEVAGIAALMNAQLNRIDTSKILISEDNLIGSNVAEDIVFIGDLFYDEEIAEILLPWLQKLSTNGKIILIGDPGRHGITENRLKFMHKLATYELTENCCIENKGFSTVHVWRFK